LRDRLPEPTGECLELAVESLDLADQLDGELRTGPSGQVPRPHRGEQCLGLQCGQVPGRAAGNEFGEQPVQPVERLGAGAGQLPDGLLTRSIPATEPSLPTAPEHWSSVHAALRLGRA